MSIRNILDDVLTKYLIERRSTNNNVFAGNYLANSLRHNFPDEIKELVKEEKDRYIVKGSAGQANWAQCPWIAIFDTLITTTAQSGYYLVYIFKEDMSGVYLSLNQGVTDLVNNYKKNVKEVLLTKANDYRNMLDYDPKDNIEIDLGARSGLPLLYENGNILARYYNKEALPNDELLKSDFYHFLNLYKQLVYSDASETLEIAPVKLNEIKQRRLHEKFDRRGNTSLKVKRHKGYKCEACGALLSDIYGEIGEKYIEAHHLRPFAKLSEGIVELDIDKDFAVLCPNCHRMIHQLSDPSNLEELKQIMKKRKR